MVLFAQGAAQNPLLPSTPELIIGTLAFFIVFGVLGKVLLPRIQRTLAERVDQIEGGLRRAERTQTERSVRWRTTRHNSPMLDTRRRGCGRRPGNRAPRSSPRCASTAGARRLVEIAQAQITAETDRTHTALRAELGTLAVDLASRILGESLADEARRRGTVDRFLDELESRSAGRS